MLLLLCERRNCGIKPGKWGVTQNSVSFTIRSGRPKIAHRPFSQFVWTIRLFIYIFPKTKKWKWLLSRAKISIKDVSKTLSPSSYVLHLSEEASFPLETFFLTLLLEPSQTQDVSLSRLPDQTRLITPRNKTTKKGTFFVGISDSRKKSFRGGNGGWGIDRRYH